jgi:hypothetical protein
MSLGTSTACLSVCDLQKLFFTFKFSYLPPSIKIETGTRDRSGSTNSKLPRSIIMMDKLEILIRSHVIFSRLLSAESFLSKIRPRYDSSNKNEAFFEIVNLSSFENGHLTRTKFDHISFILDCMIEFFLKSPCL